MKTRFRFAVLALMAFTIAAAQDSGSAPAAGQNSGRGNGGWGQRGNGMGGGMRRGVMGTVTAVAADHYTIKTDAGELYTVHFSADTRMMKQPAGMRGSGGGGGEQGWGGYGRNNGDRTPPPQIKPTDIKIGDMIRAAGDVDASAKSVDAMRVTLLDAETAERMHEMDANFGKTWLAGKVTAIQGTTITLAGELDNAPHSVVADENTTFRRRRDPVTLADIQVGDTIRVEGALKAGIFTATAVNVGGMMGGPAPGGPSGPPSGAPFGSPQQ